MDSLMRTLPHTAPLLRDGSRFGEVMHILMGTQGSWELSEPNCLFLFQETFLPVGPGEMDSPTSLRYNFMRTAGCPGETFKSHCQGWPPEHITLPQLQGEWPH